MSASKPRYRVSVNLTKEEYEAIRYIADLNNTTMSKVCAWPIEAAMPQLRKMADVMRWADTRVEKERQEVLEAFNRAESILLDALKDVDPTIDELRKLGVPIPEANPRIVTRGSTPSSKGG